MILTDVSRRELYTGSKEGNRKMHMNPTSFSFCLLREFLMPKISQI